jgi:uncharacterized protein
MIGLSPFLLLATTGPDGLGDVTPRGDAPGFVAVEDDRTLLIPDRPGNNRLDSLSNIVERPGVGLLFLVPGLDETLRVNGLAELDVDEGLRARFTVNGKPALAVIRVAVREVYLHCGKAFMRSRLWDPSRHVDPKGLPSLGEMIRDQAGWPTAESHAEIEALYRRTLY